MNNLNYGSLIWNLDDAKLWIDEFLDIYRRRPVENNRGGMTSTHLFWTWYLLRKMQPKNIIESGVFKGQGTWIMSEACPDAKIYSIDPNLAQRVYINEKVNYYTEDFNLINWEGLDKENTLCFFDDHQNAYLRLQEMKWMGFRKAIFEDNYPITQGDCYSCKKILAECGLVIDGEVKIKANSSHAKYFKRNIKTYITLPPLFRNEITRWGDKWENAVYPTPAPILVDQDIEKYKVLKEEAADYTWICYAELL